jgi:hypothetical protein
MLDQISEGMKKYEPMCAVCHVITVVANYSHAHESYLLNSHDSGSISTLKKKVQHPFGSYALKLERITAYVIATLVAIIKANYFGRPILK